VFGGNLVGGGEILRSNDIPDRAKQCLTSGELIPTEDYINIVLPFLSQPAFSDSPLFLSAVGRWHGEENGVMQALSQSNHPLKAVIHLNISDDVSFHRWEVLGTLKDRPDRHDDTRDVLATRLNEYQQKTKPVIDYYKQLGILIEIDGDKTRDEVTQDIIDALLQKATV
jgi:adenylate kinase